MKVLRVLLISSLVVACAYPVIAHHPAASIVDEEIYAMIDSMVADTPHGDMVFDEDMGSGMTQADITSQVWELEDLFEEGLLSYISLLDGDVTLTIEFTDSRAVTMTILQVEEPAEGDKAAGETDVSTFGNLKASYR